MYENERAIAYWDIPLYADNTHVKANRIDATIVDKENKKVSVIEMSCPWVENREEKDTEKTTKYGPLRWELEQRYPEYRVTQFNIIVDVVNSFTFFFVFCQVLFLATGSRINLTIFCMQPIFFT